MDFLHYFYSFDWNPTTCLSTCVETLLTMNNCTKNESLILLAFDEFVNLGKDYYNIILQELKNLLDTIQFFCVIISTLNYSEVFKSLFLHKIKENEAMTMASRRPIYFLPVPDLSRFHSQKRTSV